MANVRPPRSTAELKWAASCVVSHGKIGGLIQRLHAAGFDAREVEQRVDQFEQAQAVALGHHDLHPALRRQNVRIGCELILKRAQNERERGAKLVTDVA